MQEDEERLESEEENEDESPFHIDFDKILDDIGGFGRYQKFIYLLLCITCITLSSLSLGLAFFAGKQQHRCVISECDNLTSPTYEDAFKPDGFANFTIPYDHDTPSSCTKFKYRNHSQNTCSVENFDLHSPVKCDRWVFDTAVYHTTILSEWNLVCDDEWKASFSESVFFFGVLVATVVFGQLADLFGRKPVLMFGIVVMSGSAIALGFVTNYYGFLVCMFIVGFGQVGVFQTSFILAVELVEVEKRVLCGIIIEYFFVIGEVAVAIFAFWLRDWRKIVLAVAIPSTLYLLYWPILPESVRWLLLKKKYDQAQKEVRTIAKYNKTVARPLEVYKEPVPQHQERTLETFLDILKSKILFGRTVNLAYSWLVVAMVFYGLSLNVTSLAGSPYENFVLVALAEVPGYTVSYFGMKTIGRRLSLSLPLLVSGIACIISGFLPKTFKTVHLIMFLIGKFGITAAFGTVYLYTSELFPTSVRTLGVGTCSMCGRVGAIVSPYIGNLANYGTWIPMMVFGGNAVASGILTLFLAETLGKELPENVREAEDLGRTIVNVTAEDGEGEPLISEDDEEIEVSEAAPIHNE